MSKTVKMGVANRIVCSHVRMGIPARQVFDQTGMSNQHCFIVADPATESSLQISTLTGQDIQPDSDCQSCDDGIDCRVHRLHPATTLNSPAAVLVYFLWGPSAAAEKRVFLIVRVWKRTLSSPSAYWAKAKFYGIPGFCSVQSQPPESPADLSCLSVRDSR